jgi:hypothetical protein
MPKMTTKLSAQDRVILFCAATGIDHAAVGILAHAMQSMAIRGFHCARSLRWHGWMKRIRMWRGRHAGRCGLVRARP